MIYIKDLKYFLLVLGSCVGVSLFAQPSTLTGTIHEIHSSTALAGVYVYFENTPLRDASDIYGRYEIKNIEPGHYELVVSSIGFTTLRKSISIEPNSAVKMDFTMTESITLLPEMTIITGGMQGKKEIPGSAHYISEKAIQQFGYTDIHTILRSVPGINIQEEDGFGLRPNIGLRGTGVERSSKITLMEDGVLAAPAPYTAPAAYYFPTFGRMQSVEILKGSSQILYGPYTTGGAINLISTQIPERFAGRASFVGGSYGNRTLHAYMGNSYKNVGYLAESFQLGSNGFKQLDNNGNTGFTKQDYLAKVRVNTNESVPIYQSLMLKVGHALETSNETYLGLTEEDFKNTPYRRYAGSQKDRMNTSHSQVALTHLIKFVKRLQVTSTLYYTGFHRNWYKTDKLINGEGKSFSIATLLRYPGRSPESMAVLRGANSQDMGSLQVKANNRTYVAKGLQTQMNWTYHTGAVEHEMDVGLRWHQDQADRFQWVDQYTMKQGTMLRFHRGIPGTESNRIDQTTAVALFAQYRIKKGAFQAIPGLRFENIKMARVDYGKNDPERDGVDLTKRFNTVTIWIPGIGFKYQVNSSIHTFLGIHKGFAPPGSNENTKPELSINYEWGVRLENKSWAGEAVLFFNDYQNLLGSDLNAAGGSGSGDLYNGGRARTHGLEFQLTYNRFTSKSYDFRIPLSVVYTYTNAVFMNSFDSEFEGWGLVDQGDQFPYLANHQVTANVSLEHRTFDVHISTRYLGLMRTLPGQGIIPENEKLGDYFVVDATASYTLYPGIVLCTSVTNLTDKVYAVARRPAGLRPGLPRSIHIGLKANF